MFPGDPASRFPTGHGGPFLTTTSVARTLSSTADGILGGSERAPDHAKLEQNQCADCGMLFTAQVNLWYHVRTMHRSRFSCPQCECTFASRGGLNQHVRHIHQKLARYQCECCGKRYSSRLNYFDHIATHSGTKRHVCHVCQKEFTFKHSLTLHVARHHPVDTLDT